MRRGAFGLLSLLAFGWQPAALAQDDAAQQLLVPTVASGAAAPDVTWLSPRRGPHLVPQAPPGLELVVPGPRPSVPAVPATPGKREPKLGVVARRPGHYDLDLGGTSLSLDAVEVRALDAHGQQVDPQRSHASLSRTLPTELGAIPGEDRDALSVLLIAPSGAELSALELVSRNAAAQPIDVIAKLRPEPAACPEGVAPELVCRRTPPLRAVGDALDRGHPALRSRSIRAELGGSLQLSSAGRALLELKVGGPRQTRFGAIERLRAKLRVLVLRARAGGTPALGRNDAEARQLMLREVAAAGGIWAQCGIDLGVSEASAIQVVDPPAARLLTLGCEWGQAASGGAIRLRYGRQSSELATRAGESPSQVAARLTSLLEQARLGVRVFENQRSASAAFATVDLLLGPNKLEGLELSSTDPTMPLCSAEVDLQDGLSHFGDGDAFAGTLEERALLRALDDGDPRSIEVLVVPSFVREERIGESFIASPGSSLSSTVIIDRQAIRAGARSFALAHELGHVLLGMPGHPDDFGVDQSWSLMDADVADPTIFGPRRLSVADCERALTQSGPNALLPLLEAVPLRR